MIAVDKYLAFEYDFQTYNCSHFIAEVWKDLTGEDISNLCKGWIDGDTELCTKAAKERTRLREPKEPCVCVMQSHNLAPHVGIFIDGKILHISERGVQHDSISTLKPYYRLSYYQ